jgi:methylglutaconyl-CoA hydratase
VTVGGGPVTVTTEGGVARVLLDRPEKRNAFDDETAARLGEAFRALGGRRDLHAVVLAGAGEAFSAGGDLAWMRRVADYDDARNLADAAAFQATYDAIDRCALPVVCRVQGAALGGGAGLVAVSDVAVVAEDARLGFPEVRLGLVPGVISPYVLRKVGESRARHLFLTGETFDGTEAVRIGLAHRAVPAARLDEAVDAVLADLARAGPGTAATAKALLVSLREARGDEERRRLAREAIAAARASPVGKEGLKAFLEKRRPEWGR